MHLQCLMSGNCDGHFGAKCSLSDHKSYSLLVIHHFMSEELFRGKCEFECPGKTEIRKEELLAVGKACKAIF